ncbi:hypothetical protein NKR23_g9497 [Pleurostoma richardsiae]|uniref:Copper acquisition factor BIM1-like domain-containing protein n=1 Tax=Pleurostoma richardsiae TaxID=41990 RepID=A0AA38RF67_9PEZI|nr:hypothetical protein NKR23_g9497 [Pleurostoma richardsiae]
MRSNIAARLLVASAFSVMPSTGYDTMASDMGPAAFMWPPDRTWSSDEDNTAPCGSSSGVGNRTSFPLTGGKIALVDQTESWNIQVALSYSQDPKSNDDFLVVIAASRLADLDPGHKCVSLPDPKSGTAAGANATIQILYLSEFDIAANQTFYACADITYVDAADFTTSIPCFNVSIDDPTAVTSAPATTATATGSLQTSSSSSTAQAETGGSSGKTNVGAIAGGVVGGVAGLAALVAGFVLFRRRQRRAMRVRQQQNPHVVPWGDQFKARTSSQGSQNSIGLKHLDK